MINYQIYKKKFSIKKTYTKKKLKIQKILTKNYYNNYHYKKTILKAKKKFKILTNKLNKKFQIKNKPMNSK